MSSVIKTLDAVTTDANGDAISFNSPKTEYSIQYIATGFSSGSATLYLEASLDGSNFFAIDNRSITANGTSWLQSSGTPAMFVRARVAGLSGGKTITAYVAVVDA